MLFPKKWPFYGSSNFMLMSADITMKNTFSHLAGPIGLIGPDHPYKFQAMQLFLANLEKLFFKMQLFLNAFDNQC